MSQIKQKFIIFDTTANGTNARVIPANYTPTAYTPTAVGSEGTDKISSHLKGINNALSLSTVATDIGLTTWSGLANNTTNQTVTGFLIDSSVRSFDAKVNIYIDDGASGLYMAIDLVGVKKTNSSWTSSETNMSAVGDSITGIAWSISNASGNGQIKLSLGNISGFVSGEVLFRVITLHP